MPQTEIAVIDLSTLKSGDEKAFEQIFREYYQGLVGYAIKMLKEKEGAEEIVQEVFVKIWEKRETVEIKTSLKSYLFRSVHNHCLNQIKHIEIRENYKQDNKERIEREQEDFTEKFNQFELQRQIEQAINELPEQRQKIFRLSRFEGLKYREIAEQLDVSVKTVEAQMGKALKSMREALKEYLPIWIVWLVVAFELFKQWRNFE